MSKERLFNLIDEPWIPVVGHQEQSLRDIFTKLELPQLAGNAVDKIVLLRLLLSIAHAAIQLEDDDEWEELTPEIISSEVLKYLEEHHEKFFLFAENPFMQFPQLEQLGQPAPLESMQVNVSCGNKVVLSQWNQARELSIPAKARLLLRSCCFGCGGKRYDNKIVLTPGYTGKMNDKGKPSTGSGGTLLGYLGYLHSMILGDTILQTVKNNLLTKENIDAMGVFTAGLGRPAWEEMPQGEADSIAQEYKNSYLGALLPLDKFLLLTSNGIIMTDGIEYPNHKNGLTDPGLTIFQDGKNIRALWTNPSKRPWRELESILAFVKSENQIAPPYFLAFGTSRVFKKSKTLKIWTGGVAVSSNSGEQYLSGTDDYMESEFSIPQFLLDVEGLTIYSKLMQELSMMEKVLYSAVNRFYAELNDATGK
ncbi:MAG: type I-E CRISPR-associated protein Cse1/CasA, partial [Victivallaceae bacterium]